MFKLLIHSMLTMAVISSFAGAQTPVLLQEGETWLDIREDILGDYREIQDGENLLDINAPTRAHDAAIVPIKITQTGGERVKNLSLVIDENPAPLVAEFEFGEAMGKLNFETRVRVAQYSNFRAIATLESGAQIMAGRYIKASGGCSAPASKDTEAVAKSMGQMKFKQFAPAVRSEAQIMIRHPNYSGLQRNQVTQLFVAANFIHSLEVLQGEALLFRMDGGISISENPTFRFEYDDNGSASIRVRAVDTNGNIYQQEFGKKLL